MNPQARLAVGQTFQDWEELKDSIVDYGVATERIIVTYKKDATRFIGKCKMNSLSEVSSGCGVTVRAILKAQTEIITITKSDLQHTCEAIDHYKRRMHSRSDRLADKIMDIIFKNRQTRACSLLDTAQALVHPDIQYHTAHAAKRKAIHKLDGNEKDSFHLIHGHCRHILQRDPLATAKWSAPDGHFETLFVCPRVVRMAYSHYRPLVAFDGTFTRSMYPQILLIATTLDANNQIVMLAYMMCRSENEQAWSRFMELLRAEIPDLGKPRTIFISDRQKGLINCVDDVFPAVTKEKYGRILERIREKNQQLAEYIERTADPQHYSRAYMEVRRWGHETVQQAESLNRALKPQRQEVAFRQSNLLWDYMMRMYWEKHEVAQACVTPFPPRIMQHLKKVEEQAYHLLADVSSAEEVRVSDGLRGEFLVQFAPDWRCNCGDWQDTLLPCIHAWRACTRLKKRHLDYLSPYYTTEKMKLIYATPIPAILSTGLESNTYCGEPLVKRKAGRPTEKHRSRFEEEDPVRYPRRCGICKDRGHDKRQCPVHQANQGRARAVHDSHEATPTEIEESCDDNKERSIMFDHEILDNTQSAPDIGSSDFLSESFREFDSLSASVMQKK